MCTDNPVGCAARHGWAVLTVLVVVSAAALPSTAQVYTASFEELATTSTSVVVGKTSSVRSFWNADRTQILTEVTLDVDEQIGGDDSPQTVITVPGGRVGNSAYEVSDMPVFIEGEEVVVFLWQDASGRNLVTGGSQGRLGVTMDETLKQRVVTTASPVLQKTLRTDDAAVSAPEEKVLLTTLVRRIRDARER